MVRGGVGPIEDLKADWATQAGYWTPVEFMDYHGWTTEEFEAICGPIDEFSQSMTNETEDRDLLGEDAREEP